MHMNVCVYYYISSSHYQFYLNYSNCIFRIFENLHISLIINLNMNFISYKSANELIQVYWLSYDIDDWIIQNGQFSLIYWPFSLEVMDLFNSYITNPVVGSVKTIGSIFVRSSSTAKQQDAVEALVKSEMKSMKTEMALKQQSFGYQNLPRMSKGFLKLAAISGCAAVIMSAYGSHSN